MKYDKESAYMTISSFRQTSEGVNALFKLAVSDIFITDIEKNQVLLGTISTNNLLISSVYNFNNEPYRDLFNSLCAVCSSRTPIIDQHQITSTDNTFVQAFESSNLTKYVESFEVNNLNLSLKCKISYPN